MSLSSFVVVEVVKTSERGGSGLQNGLFPRAHLLFFEALFACLAHVLRLRGPFDFKDTIWYDLCVGSTGYHLV